MMGSSEKEDTTEFLQEIRKHFVPQPGFAAGFKVVIEEKKQPLMIVIDGANIDCHYGEGGRVDVEMQLDRASFADIVSGKIDFQTSFMAGDMKMKGDFKILRSLDLVLQFGMNRARPRGGNKGFCRLWPAVKKIKINMEETMKADNCIFCKIANGEIPAKTLYEDDRFRVILDLGPATRGHALILPKDHYADLFELPEESAGEVMKLAKKMVTKMRGKLGCEGFNLVQNNGDLAGQTVFHFHLHLIPRYSADGQKIGWKPQEVTPEELDEIRDQIIG